jgi:hypothetical protein
MKPTSARFAMWAVTPFMAIVHNYFPCRFWFPYVLRGNIFGKYHRKPKSIFHPNKTGLMGGVQKCVRVKWGYLYNWSNYIYHCISPADWIIRVTTEVVILVLLCLCSKFNNLHGKGFDVHLHDRNVCVEVICAFCHQDHNLSIYSVNR